MSMEVYYDNKKYGERPSYKWLYFWLALGGSTALLFLVEWVVIATNPVLAWFFGELALAMIRTLTVLCFGILSICLAIGLVLMNAGLPLHRKLTKGFVFTVIIGLMLLTLFDFLLYRVFGVHVLSSPLENPLILGLIFVIRVTVAVSLIFLAVILSVMLVFRAIGMGTSNEKIGVGLLSILVIVILDGVYCLYFFEPIITHVLAGVLP